jgi:hypothetical protein
MATGIVCLQAKTHLRRTTATNEQVLFGPVNENTHLEFISSLSGCQQQDFAVGVDLTNMENELYPLKSTMDAESVFGSRDGRSLGGSGTKGKDSRGALLIHLPDSTLMRNLLSDLILTHLI